MSIFSKARITFFNFDSNARSTGNKFSYSSTSSACSSRLSPGEMSGYVVSQSVFFFSVKLQPSSIFSKSIFSFSKRSFN